VAFFSVGQVWDLGMIEVGWISVAVARDNVGVVTLSPYGDGGYTGEGCVFNDFSFVAQVARLAPDVQLIENACEIGI